MNKFDLIIKGGTIATATDIYRADIGIQDQKITAIATHLEGAKQTINATDRLVLPGGIEAHCHIEQESSTGAMTSDDYYTGSVSAAFGGNTTIIPFAAQHKGQSLHDVIDIYNDRAGPKSVIDYGYHLIVSDPTDDVLNKQLPAIFKAGITSFKVFMTYDLIKIDDQQMLDILATAREHGALTMVHAENNAMIKWMVQRLIDGEYDAPKYHAPSHPRAAEVEAINRAISLARFVDAPLLIVHVSTDEGARLIAQARLEGAKIFGETCPQYMFLEAQDLDRPGAEGGKFICSPPLRDQATQQAMWRHLNNGTFQLCSSDHAPYRFDKSGKLSAGDNPPFNKIANGMPGIELRGPLLFSEGVNKGRITLNKFVELTSTNAAKLYGLHPRKGTIAIGTDADITIWDPQEEREIGAYDCHDNMDYSPYEGWKVKGWPVTVINRGAVIIDGKKLHAKRGQGEFLKRKPIDLTGYTSQLPQELMPAQNFGADILSDPQK